MLVLSYLCRTRSLQNDLIFVIAVAITSSLVREHPSTPLFVDFFKLI